MQGLLLMLWISIATSSYRGSAVNKSPFLAVEEARKRSYERSGPRIPGAVEPAPPRDMMSLVRSDDDPPTSVERDPLPQSEASSPIVRPMREKTPEEMARQDYQYEINALTEKACEAAARQTSEGAELENPPVTAVLDKLLQRARYDWYRLGMDIVVPRTKKGTWSSDWEEMRKWFALKNEEYLKQYPDGEVAARAAWNDEEFKKKVKQIIETIGNRGDLHRSYQWARLWDGREGLYPKVQDPRVRDGRKSKYPQVGTMMHNSVESKVATFGAEGDWNFTTFNAVCLTFGFLGFASSFYWYNRAQKKR